MVKWLLMLMLWPGIIWAQGTSPDTRLAVLHDHHTPVVSEMMILTIRGEYDLTVSLENMVFPDAPDYDWLQLERDDWHKERVNGRLLQIFQRRIAVFPRHDGDITIGPIHHDLTYITADQKRVELRVTAPAITLSVAPFPGDQRPLAAHSVTVTDELSADPGMLTKDETLIRRVTIEGDGTLAHLLPPRPDISQPWLISFTQPEIRETRPGPNGPVSRVVWEWELRPITGEPAILPALAFSWMDTETRRVEVAALKPIPFGYQGFGSNFDTSAQQIGRVRLLAVAVVSAGMAAALILLTWRQGTVGITRARMLLRRYRGGPHARAMRQAAAAGDLAALRRAAGADLAWRGGGAGGRIGSTTGGPTQNDPGQNNTAGAHAAIATLDRQIYGPGGPTRAFDPQDWLRRFRRSHGRD